ncbi:MAG: nucleoside monophosphate kinase [Dehalococcoidia bacterium]
MHTDKAILLLGPTGSGKTPLGNLLEQKGLLGYRCAHFDFGENLRQTAESSKPPPFVTEQEMRIIRHSLQTGSLLRDEDFHIACHILEAFIEEKEVKDDDILVMNGLPRHIGQAKDIDAVLSIKLVVYLECTAEVVHQRIQFNSGGDRTDRVDDSRAEIERKLQLFHDRTIPLLDHYRAQGSRVEKIDVAVETTPEEIHRLLQESCS